MFQRFMPKANRHKAFGFVIAIALLGMQTLPALARPNPYQVMRNALYVQAERTVVDGEVLRLLDLVGLRTNQLRLLRNAIFARHGRTFSTPQLQAYFNSRPWYRPHADYSDDQLSPVDKRNIKIVQAAELSL
jgi:hypothetical protein